MRDPRFFVGLDEPAHARHFEACFISANRTRRRRSPFPVRDWIMDSGAFTEIARFGGYRHGVEEYAAEIARWKDNGNLLAAVAQDYMCEPHMLERTGLTVPEHQRLTIERFVRLREQAPDLVYILPVLQGYHQADYVAHVRQYGSLLGPNAWVGVGSICKRNGDPRAIETVLLAIKQERPDLKLHGFGIKATAMASPLVLDLLETADSMAWSYAARRQGRDAHDWREARDYVARITGRPRQWSLFSGTDQAAAT